MSDKERENGAVDGESAAKSGVTDRSVSEENNASIAHSASGVRRFAGTAFLLTLASYLCQPNYDPVFFEQLTIGRYISAHQQVPHRFIWSAISAEHSWISLSIPFQALLGTVFGHWDFKGLLVLKLLLYVVAVFAIFQAYRRAAVDTFFAGLLATVVAAGILVRGEFTPELLGVIGFSVVLALLLEPAERKIASAAAITAVIAALFSIAPPAALVSTIGVFAAVLFSAGRPGSIGGGGSLLPRPLAVLVTAAVTFMALVWPFAGQFSAELKQRSNELLRLPEFQPAALTFGYGAAGLILTLLLAAILSLAVRRPDWRILLFLPLLFPAADFLLPYGLIGAGFFTCSIWSRNSASQQSKIGEGIARLQASLGRIPEPGLSFLLICFSIVNIFSLLQTPVAYIGMPVIEADRVMKEGYLGPVLTESPAVGYLLHRFSDQNGSPRKLVYAGRTDLSLAPGQAVKAAAAIRTAADWKEQLAAVDPQVVIVRTSQRLALELKKEAASGPNSEWRLVSVGGRNEETKLDGPDPESALPRDYQPAISWAVFVKNPRRHD